jgi:hypothetical protein
VKDTSFKETSKLHWFVVFIVMIILFLSTDALAATSGTRNQSAAGGALFVAFAIVYLSRRRAIGGWLLYFYIQLYSSFAISLIFVPQTLTNLNPKQWDNSFLYVMFFLSLVPVMVSEIMEIIAATKLLFRRNEQNVNFLRKILVTLVATSAIALAIDIAYFSDDPALIFDVLSLTFAIIWALYFSKARRVKLVFLEKNWIYIPHSQRRALTAEDKKKLRKRALVSALVIFVLFLLWTGSVLKNEGKQPDFSIFAIPLFYAFVAAIIAWYLPARRKKAKMTSVEENSGMNTEVENHDT